MHTIEFDKEDHEYSRIYKKFGGVKRFIGTVKSLTRNIPPLPVGAVVERTNSKLVNGNPRHFTETVKHIGRGNFVPAFTISVDQSVLAEQPENDLQL